MYITNALRDEIGELNKSKGWHDEGKRSIAQHCILLHSEVSEIVEDYRSNKAIDEVWYEYKSKSEEGKVYKIKSSKQLEVELFDIEGEGVVLGKPCGIPSELADVVIRALDMAYEYECDIEKEHIDKINFKRIDAKQFEFIISDLHCNISAIHENDFNNVGLNDLGSNLDTLIQQCQYIANRYNINLEQQIQDKLAYNRTRPIKHGGKRL